MSEEVAELTTLVVAYLEPEAVHLLECRLEDSLHLRPMWERMRTGDCDGRTFLGLPIATKVTNDTIENHARHLHSLLRLLDLRLTNSYMDVSTVKVDMETVRGIKIITEDSD